MKLTANEIQEVLQALLGKASEGFGDSLESEFGIRAVQRSNETIRKYRDRLYGGLSDE
jgi:hypothetical protein